MMLSIILLLLIIWFSIITYTYFKQFDDNNIRVSDIPLFNDYISTLLVSFIVLCTFTNSNYVKMSVLKTNVCYLLLSTLFFSGTTLLIMAQEQFI